MRGTKGPATRRHIGRGGRSFLRANWGRALRFERLETRELLSIVPVGAEFRVNTYTTMEQETPAVAMDSDGDFVVAWESDGQDGSSYGVYAQLYNAAGVAQGSEFRVNTSTTNSQSEPAVAMDSDGDFVVVWASTEGGMSFINVFAQRYNALGVAQGSEFRVNTYTTNAQRDPAVAMDADGDFAVVWTSTGQDGTGLGVYAQRYNASGVAQDSEFRVHSFTTANPNLPAIEMDSDGDFVVTWTQAGNALGVFARRFNAAGVAQGSAFFVNTYTTERQVRPSVALDADGDFVVAWMSYGQDGSMYGVYSQRYNAAGVAQGSEFRVNTYTTDFQWFPAVASDADGDFVVTWSLASQVAGGDPAGVYAQAYNASGVAQGGEFLVNTHTTGGQGETAIAMDADGDFVVAWTSLGQDGNLEGVYAQRFTDNLTPTTSGIANIYVPEDASDSIVDLWAAFADAEDADSALTYTVESNTTPALFTSTSINAGNGQLTLDYAPDKYGTAIITVRATDTGGKFVETTFSVTIVYPGDYNRDGSVDAADYVVWRKQSGATGVTPYSGADGNGDGDVDSDDLAVWKAHFGDTVPPPEPGSGAVAASSLTTHSQLAPRTALDQALSTGPTEARIVRADVALTASFPPAPERSFAPRRTQRPLDASRAIQAEFNFNSLLLSATASSHHEEHNSHSAAALSGPVREQATDAGALDDVFSELGRNFRRRHIAKLLSGKA